MRIAAVLVFFVIHLFATDATIEVIKKVDSLPSVAVEDASVNYTGALSQKFHKFLVSDLNVLGHFLVKDNYLQEYYSNEKPANSNVTSDYVLRFRLRQDDLGRLNCDFKLISPAKNEALFEKSYKIEKKDQYVFLAHEIVSDVNDYLGAPSVDWIKRYVIFATTVGSKKSEVVISDYTLTYKKVLLKGGLNIFPKWANEEQSAFYVSNYDGIKPTIFRYDLRTGKKSKVIESDGMAIVSDVTKDGKKLLLTMAPKGQADIFLYDTERRTSKRLTFYSGIDVSGQFLEDNKRIVFVSDRLGYPNIFAKSIHSRGVEQLVYYGKSNNSATAHKSYIIYSSRESDNEFSSNSFNLHLISTKTDFIRRLTATGVNQFPKFSNDGESVIFIKQYKKQSSIGIIRLKYNKSFIFPLKVGKIQSLDW